MSKGQTFFLAEQRILSGADAPPGIYRAGAALLLVRSGAGRLSTRARLRGAATLCFFAWRNPQIDPLPLHRIAPFWSGMEEAQAGFRGVAVALAKGSRGAWNRGGSAAARRSEKLSVQKVPPFHGKSPTSRRTGRARGGGSSLRRLPAPEGKKCGAGRAGLASGAAREGRH